MSKTHTPHYSYENYSEQQKISWNNKSMQFPERCKNEHAVDGDTLVEYLSPSVQLPEKSKNEHAVR